MLISGFVFFGWVFCFSGSLVSVSSKDFWRVGWQCVICFPGLFRWCVHREYLLVLVPGFLGRVAEEGGRRFLWFTGDESREERETTPLSSYRVRGETKYRRGGDWISGSVGHMWSDSVYLFLWEDLEHSDKLGDGSWGWGMNYGIHRRCGQGWGKAIAGALLQF